MNKQETYDYLDRAGIRYEVTDHPAVYNMAELEQVSLPYPDRDGKNLFVRDDKKKNFYLITVAGEKRVDLKEFRKVHGLRPLSFASPAQLMERMGLVPGAVTPLSLLQDEDKKITLYLDRFFAGGLIGVHPNDNTATIWLAAEDLVRVIEDHGNPVEWIDI